MPPCAFSFRRIKQVVLLVFSGILLPFHILAEEAALGPDPHPLWLRHPAISPDGKTIAFNFHGHLFVVPSVGGIASALTGGPSHDTAPIWSPDGKFIAFASNRSGHYDVYLISSQGGSARRLTTYSTNATPTGFTPDGKFVLFTAHRTGTAESALFPVPLFQQLYKVSVDGHREAELILTTSTLHAHYNRSQDQILYEDLKGYEDPFRKHETYAVAHDVWLYDSKTGEHKKLSNYQGENREPVWAPDEASIFYLSEQSGSFNVWHLLLTSNQSATQITRFEKHPVRSLSVSQDGQLCFGFDGEIYTLSPGAQQPLKVNIQIGLAESEPSTQIKHYNDNISEIALSPNGKEFAFVVRGDIYVASTDQGETKRITNTAAQERSVSFSPDGRRLLFAGEYKNRWGLYEAAIAQANEPYFFNSTVIDVHPILENEEENFQPKYSPDGREVAYLENAARSKSSIWIRSRRGF